MTKMRHVNEKKLTCNSKHKETKKKG